MFPYKKINNPKYGAVWGFWILVRHSHGHLRTTPGSTISRLYTVLRDTQLEHIALNLELNVNCPQVTTIASVQALSVWLLQPRTAH